MSRQFYKGNCWEGWFVPNSMLAVDFTIVKVSKLLRLRFPGGAWGMEEAWCVGLTNDLSAMETLCKVRIGDFNNLEEQLEALLEVDYQPTVAQG